MLNISRIKLLGEHFNSKDALLSQNMDILPVVDEAESEEEEDTKEEEVK